MKQNESSAGPLERIVASLHEAALDEARWPEADRTIGEINRTSGSALTLHERQGTHPAVLLTRICLAGRRRKDWESRYFNDYWAGDEAAPRIARLEPGRLVFTGDLYTDAEKKTSRTYNEALADARAQNGLYMRLDAPNDLGVVWGLGDSTERGGWTSDQIRLLRELHPHVRQFAIMRHALIEAEVTGTSATALLTNPRVGVIHLERSGRIATANDRALEMLRQGDGLADRDGLLRARLPEEDAELSRLLARALPPWGVLGFAGSMTVSSPKRLALHVTPVGDDYPHFRTRGLGAVVLVVDPTGKAQIDPAHVAAALDITQVESKLSVALAAGQTVRDIARATGRTEETVRWHLKQIYRKQGVKRQVDLVRRVLSLESFGAASAPASAPVSAPAESP
ncbi:helix-turn-helix transcriptional regulator [Candidatus Palauibacter sp.]|uniref:helix-turn-helix transcriptional regulator n=1 Tax=Candidatus Palauibacter sp. TaxID=3101350 RepID=UPI003B015E9B